MNVPPEIAIRILKYVGNINLALFSGLLNSGEYISMFETQSAKQDCGVNMYLKRRLNCGFVKSVHRYLVLTRRKQHLPFITQALVKVQDFHNAMNTLDVLLFQNDRSTTIVDTMISFAIRRNNVHVAKSLYKRFFMQCSILRFINAHEILNVSRAVFNVFLLNTMTTEEIYSLGDYELVRRCHAKGGRVVNTEAVLLEVVSSENLDVLDFLRNTYRIDPDDVLDAVCRTCTRRCDVLAHVLLEASCLTLEHVERVIMVDCEPNLEYIYKFCKHLFDMSACRQLEMIAIENDSVHAYQFLRSVGKIRRPTDLLEYMHRCRSNQVLRAVMSNIRNVCTLVDTPDSIIQWVFLVVDSSDVRRAIMTLSILLPVRLLKALYEIDPYVYISTLKTACSFGSMPHVRAITRHYQRMLRQFRYDNVERLFVDPTVLSHCSSPRVQEYIKRKWFENK